MEARGLESKTEAVVMRQGGMGACGAVGIVLLTHALLVARIAWVSSPNANEAAQFAAGLYHWQTGRLDLHRVNPPLVRMLCTCPWRGEAIGMEGQSLAGVGRERSEWRQGEMLVDRWGPSLFRRRLSAARLANLPWSLVGGVYCWRWARVVWGAAAGWVAVALWSFCPNILAWTASLSADVAAASLTLAACWHFRCALFDRVADGAANLPIDTTLGAFTGQRHAVLAGCWTGVALLAKMTCLTLPIIFAAMAILADRFAFERRGGVPRRVTAWCIATFLSLGILCLGYAWDRSVSPPRGSHGSSGLSWSGMGELLLPANYVRGIEQQRADFVPGRRSFCWGCWSPRGWWYYYGAAALVKLPLGTLLLSLCSVTQLVLCETPRRRLEGIMLLLPAAAFAVLVSSQTGFSQHFRYAAPCLPFAYVLASQLVATPSRTNVPVRNSILRNSILRSPLSRSPTLGSAGFRGGAWLAVAWSMASSGMAWPRSHAYFHELAGGPAGGHRYLADSSLEWGEDVDLAAEWFRERGIRGPIYRGLVHDRFLRRLEPASSDWPETLRPGWYLVSMQRVSDPEDACHVLHGRTPEARIGAALVVYRVAAAEGGHRATGTAASPAAVGSPAVDRGLPANQGPS